MFDSFDELNGQTRLAAKNKKNRKKGENNSYHLYVFYRKQTIRWSSKTLAPGTLPLRPTPTSQCNTDVNILGERKGAENYINAARSWLGARRWRGQEESALCIDRDPEERKEKPFTSLDTQGSCSTSFPTRHPAVPTSHPPPVLTAQVEFVCWAVMCVVWTVWTTERQGCMRVDMWNRPLLCSYLLGLWWH